MIKEIAWNTFKNTGSINTFLELKQIEHLENSSNLYNQLKNSSNLYNQKVNLNEYSKDERDNNR